MVLKVKKMGDAVMGVELKGNPKNPEPIHFRVVLPFGNIDITRTTKGEYWVHTIVNRTDDGWDPFRTFGKFDDARLDIIGKHSSKVNKGDFNHPKLNHVALKLSNDTDS